MSDNFFKNAALFLVAAFLFYSPLSSAYYPQQYGKSVANNNAADLKNTLSDLRHQLSNQDVEIREFEEKLHSHSAMLESFRAEQEQEFSLHKDYLKENITLIENKISSLESSIKNLVDDFKKFKNNANETVEAFSMCKKKFAEMEKQLEVQNKHINQLEGVVRNLVDILQANEPSFEKATEGKTYKVQPGDTLEKIANRHGTTIKALKELNHLSQDRIFVGQTLKLP